MILKNKTVWIPGHTGLVGTALEKLLKNEKVNLFKPKKRIDLRIQSNVKKIFKKNKIDIVFLLAAKVGGIYANSTYPGQFIYDNLMIETNIIHESYENKVKKLIFLGSSCIYPKNTKTPIKEKALLSGYLEKTNEYYAIAKIAGIKMCEAYFKEYNANFISVMPTNIYGPNDNFHSKNSHVIPALIKKVFEAKKQNNPFVTIWGTGTPKRELLFVDDCASALIYIAKNYNKNELINIGSGEELSIISILKIIMKKLNYKGEIKHDLKMPDGQFQKKLNIMKINKLGWKAKYKFKDGLSKTIDWYLKEFN